MEAAITSPLGPTGRGSPNGGDVHRKRADISAANSPRMVVAAWSADASCSGWLRSPWGGGPPAAIAQRIAPMAELRALMLDNPHRAKGHAVTVAHVEPQRSVVAVQIDQTSKVPGL